MHVIAYKVAKQTGVTANKDMAVLLDVLGATKVKGVNTLWTVPSRGRTSEEIRKELKQLVLDHGIPAKRVRLWVAGCNPADVEDRSIKIK